MNPKKYIVFCIHLIAIAILVACEPMALPTSLHDEISDPKGVQMLLVPAGDFTMGSDAGADLTECRKFRSDCTRSWFIDEEPPHLVYLDAFYIDKYEVTNALYAACVGAGECLPPKMTTSYTRASYYGDPQYGDYPVVHVDWNMANAYCEWRGARLPSEAEWEKAARGTDGRIYPWGNAFDDGLANFCDRNCPLPDRASTSYDDGYTDTAPVGAYPGGVSPYGIFGMAGNVWEWVADWYSAKYYSRSPDRNPPGPDAGQDRVIRGGSWNRYVNHLQTANRRGYDPTLAYGSIGFRCARDISQ